MGGKLLAGFFRLMCLQHKHLSGGLPDLCLVRLRLLGPAPQYLHTLSFLDGSITLDLDHYVGDVFGVENFTMDEDLNLLSPDDAKQVPTPQATLLVYDGPELNVPWEEFGCVSECMLAEVKGPSDALSSKQRMWLQLLRYAGVEAHVVRVKEGLGAQARGSHVSGSRKHASAR
jgi:hypothetical protein